MASAAPKIIIQKDEGQTPSWREFLFYFLKLGWAGFGDPEARINRMARQVVKRSWLSPEHLARVCEFCRLLPGPQELLTVIHVGYLKRKVVGGLLAGLLFVLPGALLMIVISSLYVAYATTPQGKAFLFILKPAALGVLLGATVKLGAAAIRNYFLALLMLAAAAALSLGELNLILILLGAGTINALVCDGQLRLQRRLTQAIFVLPAVLLALPFLHPHWLRMFWLFLKTGFLSFAGATTSLAFLYQGAYQEHHWISEAQLLDALAFSLVLPGPSLLFSTFAGYLAGGPVGAIVATGFVFLPAFLLVLFAARHSEKFSRNKMLQSFISGVTAAVVGVVISVAIDLAPEALQKTAAVVLTIGCFLAVVVRKIEAVFVAAAAVIGGVIYAYVITGA